MKAAKFISLSLLVVLLNSCSIEPQPIKYGSDACEFCRMTISDPRFSSELVTKKGKVHKFDSIECMIRYMKKNQLEKNLLSHILVSDYTQESFIHAESSVFVKAENINSPMGEGLAAFTSKEDLQQIIRGNGNNLSWNEVSDLIK